MPRKAISLSKIVARMVTEGISSRGELTRVLGFSKPAITQAINKLFAKKLLIEGGRYNKTKFGRKTTMLSVRPDFAYFVGTDLEGTAIRACVLDSSRKVVARAKRTLGQQWPKSKILSVWTEMLENVIASSNIDKQNICSLGIGLPGLVSKNEFKTKALVPPGKWMELDVSSIVEKLNLPAFASHNLVCLTEYERKLGQASEFKSFYSMIIRYGVALTRCVDGIISTGNEYISGEFGHVKIVPDGKKCICGHKGCLGCYISGRTWDPDSFETDEEFNRELAKRAEYLGIALSNFLKVFYSPYILLNGIYNDYEPTFKKYLTETLKDELTGFEVETPEVVFGVPSEMKISIGAAQLAANNFLEQYSYNIILA
jgi:predicted NBD/HSP70 family sugar kinase